MAKREFQNKISEGAVMCNEDGDDNDNATKQKA